MIDELEIDDDDDDDAMTAWAEYHKDYGVKQGCLTTAHKAFLAGWKAAREGNQSGPLR